MAQTVSFGINYSVKTRVTHPVTHRASVWSLTCDPELRITITGIEAGPEGRRASIQQTLVFVGLVLNKVRYK